VALKLLLGIKTRTKNEYYVKMLVGDVRDVRGENSISIEKIGFFSV
jgi:hypothetical protein